MAHTRHFPGLACGVLGHLEVETAILVTGLSFATGGGRHFILRSVEDAAATGDLDARVLAVRETELEGRRRPFWEVVSELSETDWTKFLIWGSQNDSRAMQVHSGSGHCTTVEACALEGRVGLNASDQAVMDHEFCARVLQSAVGFDHLNVNELACMELICRKMQVAEYRHRERIPSGRGGAELQKDLHLCNGKGIAPAMLDHMTGELPREANVLKERRTMRKERQASRGGSEGNVSASSLYD